MTLEERAIALEIDETKILAYRDLIAEFDKKSANIRRAMGLVHPCTAQESAYSAQVETAWLCYQILSNVVPVFDVVEKLATTTPGIGVLLDKMMKKAGIDLDIAGFPEFVSSLNRATSHAATSVGLPPCLYYGIQPGTDGESA